ncbi:Ig-like domain-containing protein [Kiritimatiellaeota bacterium B1221]|nr:Ig-like domain-containing protein [Kiritimatiellaeota bacterium B1221]
MKNKHFPLRVLSPRHNLLVSILSLAWFSPLWVFADLNVDVEVVTTPAPQVTIDWNSQGNTPVRVKRRLIDETGVETWNLLAEYPTAGSPPFIDTTVVAGETYEYSVDLINTVTSGTSNRIALFVATIGQPLVDTRGAVLLVVEDTWATELQEEIKNLELSLVGDGWEVIRLDWGREGTGDEAALKAAIQAAVQAKPEINSLFLFGAVGMVKSGWLGPDGHGSHPHETDLFYADLDAWNDSYDTGNYTAGDGIYDPSNYPSSIELATGRVTFHNMSAYKKNEVEYLRDYIHKEHAYRNLHRDVSYQNYVGDDHYLYASNTVLKAMVGDGNWTDSGNLNTIIGDESYLFAFGNRTSDWAPARDTFQKAIFTACFRSHILQFWDSNNHMRGMLAQPDWGLTALWGGRPAWYLHKMAAGRPIGESVVSTQNDLLKSRYTFTYNSDLGQSFYTQSRDYYYFSDEYPYPVVTANLMGDPTLRIAHVDPVSSLTITRSDSDHVQLNWNASPAADLVGYHVYASQDRLGAYTRLTTTPLTTTTFEAVAVDDVETWFQVRAVADVTVPTGVYQDQSQGRFALAYDDGSVNTPPVTEDLAVNGKINTPLKFNFPGSDVDGDTLTPIVIDNPDNGQIRWYEGQPYYISKRDTSGTDTATFVFFDGVTVSEPSTVTFTTDELGDSLLGWEFPDGTTAAQSPTFSAPHVGSSAISGGPGTNIISAWPGTDTYTSRYIGSSLDPNNDYFKWTVTPESGFMINLDQVTMGICGDSGSEIFFELRVSTDGFSTYETVPLNLSSVPGKGYGGNAGTLVHGDLSGIELLQNQSQSVDFRLHFWHTGASSKSIGVGKITDPVYYDAIEDISFRGSVTTLAGNPLIDVTETDVLVNEEGGANIGVRLSAAPDAPLTLTLAKVSGDADLTLGSPSALQFDSGNWSRLQTITFDAAYDADLSSGTALFQITGPGLDTVSLTVTEIDTAQAPVGSLDSYIVTLDTVLNVDAAGGVLANDTDANGEALTAVLVEDVSHGTLTLHADGSFSYQPESGFDGVDSFTYKADDGLLQSDVTTVTLGLLSTNLKVRIFNEIRSFPVGPYGGSQNEDPEVTILGGRTVTIDGNGWQMVDLTSIEITADTVLEFDFSSSFEGEIHGIGFDDDTEISADNTFQVYGEDVWSTSEQLESYGTRAPNTKRYVIHVGEFYTGTFRYLFFVNDDDEAPTGNGTFSNIHIYDASAANAWAKRRGLDPLGNYGLTDDANGDGKPNLYHFAFDTHPMGDGSTEGKQRGSMEIDSENDLPYFTLTLPVRAGAVFSGNPPTSAPIDGLVYQIIAGSDLSNLSGDLTLEELPASASTSMPALGDYDETEGPDWEYRSFRVTPAIPGIETGFIQVKVTEAE